MMFLRSLNRIRCAKVLSASLFFCRSMSFISIQGPDFLAVLSKLNPSILFVEKSGSSMTNTNSISTDFSPR